MSDASSARPVVGVDMIDDGMTDEEIAVHTDRWRADLDESPVVASPVNAAEILEAMRADEAL
ncbi:hypothetical protein [Ilumatobacter sp.]|uniref:hypothetical protein n=1 Tax=Ilumatobacter sp. TaxID=1967498 RepID=UPI003751E777